jgi:tetratricopeptide (TPR) repeat protein
MSSHALKRSKDPNMWTAVKLFVVVAITSQCLLISIKAQDEMHDHQMGQNQKIGRVHFPVSCGADAQAKFDRAVALLHSFWYEKAIDSFTLIGSQHPECTIAYWGIAMTYYHPLWEKPDAASLKKGLEAVERGRATKRGTAREKDYLEAIGSFYRDYESTDLLSRILAYEKSMEQLHAKYPSDREAGVFYSLALIASAQALPPDKTYGREKKAGRILNAVLAVEPQHPGVIHYLIHAYDSPSLAPLALNAARAYAKIAPGVPHALHMPSHIFTRLGLWQESIRSNIVSEVAAKKFAADMKMDGAWDEQLHAMDYLEYAYLQSAEDKHAKAVLDELYRIKSVSPQNFKVWYAFAAIPARYALERGNWVEAANLQVYPANFPWKNIPWSESVTYFARAVGAARSGDPRSARRDIERLGELEKALAGSKEALQVTIQRLAATGWADYADGQANEALAVMRSAADLEDTSPKHPVTPGPILPAREMLGDLLLQMNQPSAALTEFEAVLTTSPNRSGALLGAARAADLSGDKATARKFYAKLAAASANGDLDHPGVKEARAFLAKR